MNSQTQSINISKDDLYSLYVLLTPQPLTKDEIIAAHAGQEGNFLLSEIFQNAQIHRNVSGNRKGMQLVYDIVANLKRDFKKVKDALTVEGAQAIVDKHNRNCNNKWVAVEEDVNGDNIPDIIIKNEKNNPIVVNGWTTKKSDYPMKRLYAAAKRDRQLPLDEETHRPISYAKYKTSVRQLQYQDDSGDIHNAGNLTNSFDPIPPNWNLKGYSTTRKLQQRLTAYNRFKTYILSYFLTGMFNYVVSEIQMNEKEAKRAKITVLSKVSALAWNHYILETVAQHNFGNNNISTEAFKKFKNSDHGKVVIDNTVTNFYLHLFHTNEQGGWSEQNRARLLEEFEHFLLDNIQALLQNQQVNQINEHHYGFNFQPRDALIHGHQQQQDGEWGEDFDDFLE